MLYIGINIRLTRWGAERAWGEADPLQASSWSSSNTGYVALPEGANVNSPDANWVFDYGAYLPVSGRNDNIYYRIGSANLNLNSISVVNHNATETAYYGTDGVYHPKGGSTSIKIVSNAPDSVWNIGTFTYTGANGTLDKGVAFGSSANDAYQADIVVGEMNIGQIGNVTVFNVGSSAAGTCYATIDENNVKKGDAVSLSDSGGPKSLTITGDFNIYGNSTIYMNVWDNAKDALHSEENPDISIGGVVRMVSGSGASPVWHVINRSATVTWGTGDPAPSATDTYVKLGGLEGNGKLTNNSKTLEASTLKLIFTNQTDCEFTGEFNDGQSDTVKTIMSVKMAGADGKKQIIRADDTYLEGGRLGILYSGRGFLTTGFHWSGGVLELDVKSTSRDNLQIGGILEKVGDGKLVFDLNLTSADYDAIELGSSVKYDLLSAESISNFGESLNDDFEILGMDNSQFAADFFYDEASNILSTVITHVPEPEAAAALLGGLALALIAFKRRGIRRSR